MKPWQVRQSRHGVVWHIRLVATALERTLGCGAMAVDYLQEEVQNERARSMNIISDLYEQLIRSVEILGGQEERFDPKAERTLVRLVNGRCGGSLNFRLLTRRKHAAKRLSCTRTGRSHETIELHPKV
jgi:hypothetical protein